MSDVIMARRRELAAVLEIAAESMAESAMAQRRSMGAPQGPKAAVRKAPAAKDKDVPLGEAMPSRSVGRPPAGLGGTAVNQSLFKKSWLRLGVAGVASAVVAAALCLPFADDQTVAPPPQLRPTMEPALPSPEGFDLKQAWHEEHAQLANLTGLGPRTATDDAWRPDGGLSTLLATRFPSAGNVRLPDADAGTDINANTDVAAVPLPAPRPGGVAHSSVARVKPVVIEPQVAALPPQQPKPGYFDFFHKLFADPDQNAKAVLAANPKTVLYDITKRVVYMPDGDKLEAHSGYGKYMDDPNSVSRKDYGATPPNVYSVSFREKLFHGVRALRMKPVGTGNMYGRDGILAHSYMLGDDGESNGCVSVRDYDRFLQAYEAGKFDRIIVVRSADEPRPSQVANAAPGGA